MANIQPYESQVVSDSGISTNLSTPISAEGSGFAAVGEGLTKLSQGLEKYQDKHQAMTASADLTNFKVSNQAALTSLDKSFDPEDPDVQQQMLKPIDDWLEQTTSKMSSPSAIEYATKRAETYKASYWEQALHKNSQLIHKEVGAQVQQYSSSSGQVVYMNPDGLEDALKDVDHFLGTLQGSDGTKQALKAQIDRTLNVSAAHGLIKQDPYEAEKALGENRFDVSGEDLNRLTTQAQNAIHARERTKDLTDKKMENKLKQQMLQNTQTLYGQIDEGNIDFNALNDAEVQNKITPEQHTILANRLNNKIDGTFHGDASVFRDALEKINLPAGDPNKITDFQTLVSKYNQGKGKGLDKNQLNMLAGIYMKPENSSGSEEAMFSKLIDDSAKKLIQPSAIPWGDRQGLSNWSNFLTNAHQDYAKKMATGNFTSEQLLDPTSKDYIGKSMNSYQRSRSDLSAQAAYVLHGPVQSLNSGAIPQQPVGANPKLTPLPNSGPQSGGMNAKQQAAIEAIMSKLPPAGGQK